MKLQSTDLKRDIIGELTHLLDDPRSIQFNSTEINNFFSTIYDDDSKKCSLNELEQKISTKASLIDFDKIYGAIKNFELIPKKAVHILVQKYKPIYSYLDLAKKVEFSYNVCVGKGEFAGMFYSPIIGDFKSRTLDDSEYKIEIDNKYNSLYNNLNQSLTTITVNLINQMFGSSYNETENNDLINY